MSNVVLVTIDSLRADHLGAYGYDRNTTPVIDKMAAEGMYFDAYANSHWTRASFPSIITSTYPMEYGGYQFLSDSRVTVGEAMKNAGHRTAAFHSNLWLSRDYNYNRGFDHFYDSKSEPSLLSRLRTYVKLHINQDSPLYRVLQWLYDTTEEKAGIDVGQTYQDAKKTTDNAIEWVESVDTQEDIFLWVHYMDVHHPYVPHDRDARELGVDLDVSERDAIKLRRKMLENSDKLSENELQTLVDLYDTEIRYTDRHIGRLRNAISNSLGLDDTAFVVTSDHGEEFGEHGGFSHNPSFYDEVLHVPFIVDGADRVGVSDSTGKQIESIELLDTAPTVCDLGGEEPMEIYRGRSAINAIGTGKNVDLFSETGQGEDWKVCLRSDGWKFIWDRDSGIKELYNLDSDPGEKSNVLDENPEIGKEYEEAVQEHLAEVRETNEDLPEVGMDSGTEERLKNLGYLE